MGNKSLYLRMIALESCAVPVLISCGGGGGSPSEPLPRREMSAPALTPTHFVDVTASSGIAFVIGYRQLLPPEANYRNIERIATGGVASGDYDNDGDIDLFITRGDIGPNLLYRNNGFGVFVDVAASAGLANTATATENYRHSGPAFADMDGDGHLDLFISGIFGDPSLIFANNGDGTFTDVTAGSGIDSMQSTQTIAASFGDYDLDGDLDAFVTHWGAHRDLQSAGDTEHLWRNDTVAGKIVFTSVSESAGIASSIWTLPDPLAIWHTHDATFAASFARIDDDLFPDIVVASDFNQSMLFLNNGDGTFRNATDVNVITDNNGMGSALGDYDGDGDLDWFVTAIYEEPSILNPNPVWDGNRLYRNDNGVFVDVTSDAGVRDGGWGWAACFMDFENDGNLDIYHTNGYPPSPYNEDVSRAFVSNGSGRFSERAGRLGLDDTEEGRGVICADFDNDGDIDIFQMHRGSPVAATMWRNERGSDNNFLRVRLNGDAPNTKAAGARIFATIGSRTMMEEIILGNSFLSQQPATKVFGLGSSPQVDELRVEWPNGEETIRTNVLARQTITLNQSN